jgi:hypothetical protein
MSDALDRPLLHPLRGRQRHLAAVQGAAVRLERTCRFLAAAADHREDAGPRVRPR